MRSELPAEVVGVSPVCHGGPCRDDAAAGGDSAHRNLALLYGGARANGPGAGAGVPADSRVGTPTAEAAGCALAGS
jgi:hypothetical protein